jgi:hypothetical protein
MPEEDLPFWTKLRACHSAADRSEFSQRTARWSRLAAAALQATPIAQPAEQFLHTYRPERRSWFPLHFGAVSFGSQIQVLLQCVLDTAVASVRWLNLIQNRLNVSRTHNLLRDKFWQVVFF